MEKKFYRVLTEHNIRVTVPEDTPFGEFAQYWQWTGNARITHTFTGHYTDEPCSLSPDTVTVDVVVGDVVTTNDGRFVKVESITEAVYVSQNE